MCYLDLSYGRENKRWKNMTHLQRITIRNSMHADRPFCITSRYKSIDACWTIFVTQSNLYACHGMSLWKYHLSTESFNSLDTTSQIQVTPVMAGMWADLELHMQSVRTLRPIICVLYQSFSWVQVTVKISGPGHLWDNRAFCSSV